MVASVRRPSTTPAGRASALDGVVEESDGDRSDEDRLPPPSDLLIGAVMNFLANGGTHMGELFVLSVAVDEHRRWELRNRALFALSLFRPPSTETLRAVWTVATDTRVGHEHVRSQARLVYGSMVHTADKLGTR